MVGQDGSLEQYPEAVLQHLCVFVSFDKRSTYSKTFVTLYVPCGDIGDRICLRFSLSDGRHTWSACLRLGLGDSSRSCRPATGRSSLTSPFI